MPDTELPELKVVQTGWDNVTPLYGIITALKHYFTKAQAVEIIRRANAYPAQQSRIEELEKAMIKYGQHHAYCPLKYGDELNSCTCGFEQALKKEIP